MNGTGVFFNQIEDLDRIKSLPIDWVTPIMAPDQSSVQGNRQKWATWRAAMPNVKFYPWIVCDDPEIDAERTEWVVRNYPSDGIVLNCEKAYESGGKWKAKTLMDRLAVTLPSLPKMLSYPSSPAEIFDMDYRAFDRAGCWFAPQAYWNEFDGATPHVLWRSAYLPNQLHVGRDYRLQVFGVAQKPWGRIVSWNGGTEAVIRNMASTKLFRLRVVPQDDNGYKYMTVDPLRKFYDYKTGNENLGKILGFCAPNRIVPTVGIYEVAGRTLPTPAEVKNELGKVPNLTGASVYLGEYGWSSDYVYKTQAAVAAA